MRNKIKNVNDFLSFPFMLVTKFKFYKYYLKGCYYSLIIYLDNLMERKLYIYIYIYIYINFFFG